MSTSEASVVKTFSSEAYDLPVRSLTSWRNARSVGANAVARLVPSARISTGLLGLAPATA